MIISISGFIGSGKDTVADYLVTEHGFRRMSFAESLKGAVAAVFGWDPVMLEGTTKTSRIWREQKDEWWSNRLGSEITPRHILQQWGTEVCRKSFHDDIWIASVENKLRLSTDDVVITDCRFPNEVKAIKEAAGITIRVSRGEQPDWYEAAEAYNRGPDGNSQWSTSKTKLDKSHIHASEYSSVGLKYDYYIDNNGTIDELSIRVSQLLNLPASK